MVRHGRIRRGFRTLCGLGVGGGSIRGISFV